MGNEFLGEKLLSGLVIRRNGREFYKKNHSNMSKYESSFDMLE